MSNLASSGSVTAVRDELFDILADTSRRAVLRIVTEQSPVGIAKNDLAFQLAAVLADKPLASVSENDYQQVHAELHHRHVPHLTNTGLLAETDDGSIVTGDHPAYDDPRLEESISGNRDADREALDTVFRALADERRRTILSVLSDQYHPIGTETLARDVAAREAETTERDVPQERVDDVRLSLVHLHLPLLSDATLIGYDTETARVSYEGHPDVRAEWIRPADGAEPTDSAALDVEEARP